MKPFLISIITVSHNQANFIEDNIQSILKQDYPDVQHIIIDAVSTDGTIDILQRYPHVVWTSEPDKGQSEGLNKGFRKATGDIIGWINSDDRIANGALNKVARYFQLNPSEIAVVGDQVIIDEKSNQVKIIKSRSYSYDYLLHHAKGITQNSIFFKRHVFDQIGYLDETLHYAMDRDLFIRIASIKTIPYLPETLGEYRIHGNSKTSKGTYNFAKELIRIRAKYSGNHLSPASKNDYYIIITEPLRRCRWLRSIVQKWRKKNA